MSKEPIMYNKEDISLNIGKKCKVIESAIVGLGGKIGIIKDIVGNRIEGYRYEIEIEKPLYSFTTKTNFFPPVFLVEIIKEDNHE